MLFSGLGDIETVQDTISVGVGALAGSTIMLLTIPFGLSIIGGRVNLEDKDGQLVADYSKPKLKEGQSYDKSGVAVKDEIKHAAYIMLLTTVPYFLIQIPAFFIHGTHQEIVQGERIYAFLAFIICIAGFVLYLAIHVKASKEDEDRIHRMELIKDLLNSGRVSLTGAFLDVVETYDNKGTASLNDYQSIDLDVSMSKETKAYLSSVLKVPFQKYDKDASKGLQKEELSIFLSDFKGKFTFMFLNNRKIIYD